MTFSIGFLEVIIYGSLGWCALSVIGLSATLVRDIVRGETW
ncbi:hypothetical protein [Novosphingobium sp. PC22D]|nr:hypothetical protein [Novosphingobium sp. PC22D]